MAPAARISFKSSMETGSGLYFRMLRRVSRASIVSMVCAPFSHAAVRRVLPTIPPAPHHSGAGRH